MAGAGGRSPSWAAVVTDCPDCANPALEYRVGHQCAYHHLVNGGIIPDPMRQALAVTINPIAFEKIAGSFVYFSLNSPKRGRKFGPWEERDIQDAFAAADRVRVLVGW
jgi:hypothetical protein